MEPAVASQENGVRKIKRESLLVAVIRSHSEFSKPAWLRLKNEMRTSQGNACQGNEKQIEFPIPLTIIPLTLSIALSKLHTRFAGLRSCAKKIFRQLHHFPRLRCRRRGGAKRKKFSLCSLRSLWSIQTPMNSTE
jgi:hypothetical protein